MELSLQRGPEEAGEFSDVCFSHIILFLFEMKLSVQRVLEEADEFMMSVFPSTTRAQRGLIN